MNIEEAFNHLKELTGYAFGFGRFFSLTVFSLENEFGRVNLLHDQWRGFYVDDFELSKVEMLSSDQDWERLITDLKKTRQMMELIKRSFSDKELDNTLEHYKSQNILKNLPQYKHKNIEWHYGKRDLSGIDIYGLIKSLDIFDGPISISFMSHGVEALFPYDWHQKDLVVLPSQLTYESLQKENPWIY